MLLSNYNPVLSTVLARHSQCGRGSALTKLAPIPNAILGARNGREISHDKGVMDPQQGERTKGRACIARIARGKIIDRKFATCLVKMPHFPAFTTVD